MTKHESWRALAQWPHASLRTHLVAMILAATVPLAALVSFQIIGDVKEQRALLNTSLQAVAKAVAGSVDRELASSVDALHALARSTALQRGDRAGFERLLGAAASMRPAWSGAFLSRADGTVVFDSRVPIPVDALQPDAGPRPATLQAVTTGRPTLSNVVDAADPARRVTAVTLPLVLPDGTRCTLGAYIAPAVWQTMIEDSGAPGGGFAALFDAEHRLIARSPQPERFVGSRLPASAIASMGDSPSGVHYTALLHGGEAYAAWQRIDHGDWGIGIGVPAEAIEAAHDRSVLVTLGVAIACLLLGVTAAMLVARRIAEPLSQLARRGVAGRAPPIAVREIAQLRDALSRAAWESQAAADRLAKKAEEFETLFYSSPLGLAFAQDAQCAVVLRNAALDRMLPWSLAWGTAQPAGAATPHVLHDGRPLPAERRPLWRAATRGESVTAMELEVRLPGRAPQFVLSSAVPLCDSSGRPRGAIGATVDITERKHAEALLRASEQQLRQSQDLVNLAQEVGNVGFFHYRWQTGQLTLSPGQTRQLGVGPNRDAPGVDIWRECVPARRRVGVARDIQRMVAARAPSGRVEFAVGGGETQRWLESRLVFAYAAAGPPLQIIGLTIDISDHKRSEHERAAMIEREQAARHEAEAANRAKDEFLSMLGHELRNPMNAIATSVEVLHRAPAGAPEAGVARDIIARQTRKLARMLDDLLDVGRVMADQVELLRQPLELASLVQRRLAAAQAGALAKGQTLQAELAEVWVQADVQRIAQVLDNLLDNAVKYSPAGGRIVVELTERDGSALLRIRDDGGGIAPELLRRMFEPFVQGARSLDRSAGGMGIGLTLVRRLVEAHGGSVEVQSDAAGSVFEVRLPATPAPSAARPVGMPEARRSRIVVVDDNPDALSGLRVMLELDGHLVQTSADGAAGLAMLLEQAPDMAIVDIGLPLLDGYEVAQRSRAGGYRGRLIALSGYGRAGDLQRSRAAGFEAHLVKPVDAEQLLRLLAAS